jgi:hypothetical protein
MQNKRKNYGSLLSLLEESFQTCLKVPVLHRFWWYASPYSRKI